MLRRGAARHREAVVGEHLAGAGDMGQHAVEDASAMPVVVHPEFEEMAQKAAGLRHAEGERVLDRTASLPRPAIIGFAVPLRSARS